MKLDDIKTKIEKIKKEKKQLATRHQQLQAIMNKKKKSEDTRRKIVLGAFILKELEKNKGLQTYVVGLLKNLREGDRELFSDLVHPKESEDKASS
jgi:large subunit ribosomal protein L7/L12